MRISRTCPTLSDMDTEHEDDRGRDYDQDTVGDHDETTLDGSEGLDADVLTTDGEDLTMEPPETWIPAEEHHGLDEKLAAERPDVGETPGGATVDTGSEGRVPADERRDAIDELDPEGETRVLGQD